MVWRWKNVMQNGTYIFISQTLSVNRNNNKCQLESWERKDHYNAIISKRRETKTDIHTFETKFVPSAMLE